jgi:hypothetical protein
MAGEAYVASKEKVEEEADNELVNNPATREENMQTTEDKRKTHEKYRRFMDDRNDGLPRIHSPWGREPKGKHKKGGDTIRRSGHKS